MSLKSTIKSHKSLLYLTSVIYSLGFIIRYMPLILKGRLSVKGAYIRNCKINLNGINVKIQIGERTRCSNCSFYCEGAHTSIYIKGGKSVISNTSFHAADSNSCILIDSDFTMEGGHIAATEGNEIRIGQDCMFSNHIEIRNGDSHSILANGKRINHGKNILIGNHVWLCANVKIMKGSHIADNCIIGNSSLISSTCGEPNSIYAGIPAKLVKQNISWDRHR